MHSLDLLSTPPAFPAVITKLQLLLRDLKLENITAEVLEELMLSCQNIIAKDCNVVFPALPNLVRLVFSFSIKAFVKFLLVLNLIKCPFATEQLMLCDF